MLSYPLRFRGNIMDKMLTDSSLNRWGGLAAMGVGLSSFLYGVLYTVLVVFGPKLDPAASLTSSGIQITNFILALSGFLAIFAVVAIFQRVLPTNAGWAHVALA